MGKHIHYRLSWIGWESIYITGLVGLDGKAYNITGLVGLDGKAYNITGLVGLDGKAYTLQA